MRLLYTLIILSALLHPVMSQKKVAIIGGGMAGIAAADRLMELDSTLEIHLYEKANQLGGNAQSYAFKHQGNDIAIDIGPQYFAKGAWDHYIALLKKYDLYQKSNYHNFKASIAIMDGKGQNPLFLSPKGGLKRLELQPNLKFLKFYNAARDVYKDKVSYPKSLGTWVADLDIDSSFKQQVILPFLASSLGTSIKEIEYCSTQDIIKLFAFQSPTKGNTFKVLDQGMGHAIISIGRALENQGVRVHLQEEVKQILQNNLQWILETSTGKSLSYDYCIIATHANHCAELLPKDESFDTLKNALQQLSYFKARIVLHTDSTYVAQGRSASFFNVQYDLQQNQILSNTMNLGFINPKWEGVYKSWLSTAQVEELKANRKFIHEVVFDHPMITHAAVQEIRKAMQLVQKIPHLYIIGGWSLGLETQESACLSGFQAAVQIAGQ